MKLFEPGRIGKLSLKNRLVMAPMAVGFNDPDGRISQKGMEYHVARAKGGIGLIITGSDYVNRDIEQPPKATPHAHHFLVDNRMMADDDVYLGCYNELAESLHDYGTKIAVQLTTGLGRVVFPGILERGGSAVAPSAQPCFFYPDVTARELTVTEIERLVKDYESSSRLMKAAGIDAIEIHGHMGYTIDQFTTALWNKRSDRYGGNLDNRLRFVMELIGAVKSGAGTDFPIIYRYGLTHYFKGAREIDEGLEIAYRLETAGVDAINIDAGCYDSYDWCIPPTTRPSGLWIDLAEVVKQTINIPVIVAGKLGNPELAESVLQQAKADFIALGRPLLADPEWPVKVKEGRFEDIRPCIGDHEGCLVRMYARKNVSCTVNPATGMEREFELKPAEKKKSVLVIGGGPGGMEAARVAALRGHKVTLLEKSAALGGNLIPAGVPDFKREYRSLVEYFATQIKKLGVTVIVNKEATPEIVREMNPEVIFIATGGIPAVPDIPGVDRSNVVTATDVLLGRREVGEPVMVIGGGLIGCEVALYLAQKGKQLTIIEVQDSVMGDIPWMNRMHLMQLLNDAGVDILTDTEVLDIMDDGITITNKSNRKDTMEVGTVIIATGMRPNNGLAEELKDQSPEVHVIGDCAEPRKVINAMWEGFRTARLV